MHTIRFGSVPPWQRYPLFDEPYLPRCLYRIGTALAGVVSLLGTDFSDLDAVVASALSVSRSVPHRPIHDAELYENVGGGRQAEVCQGPREVAQWPSDSRRTRKEWRTKPEARRQEQDGRRRAHRSAGNADAGEDMPQDSALVSASGLTAGTARQLPSDRAIRLQPPESRGVDVAVF